ncbi:hypothetical protein PQX77_013677 [Marasmius sp. AFHP31]|nr:hypothetical protein PQX77_013677 [Marasmius sp. AFHP31]
MPRNKKSRGSKKRKEESDADFDVDDEETLEMSMVLRGSGQGKRKRQPQTLVLEDDVEMDELSPDDEPTKTTKKRKVQCPTCGGQYFSFGRHRQYCHGDTGVLLRCHKDLRDLPPATVNDPPIAGPSGVPDNQMDTGLSVNTPLPDANEPIELELPDDSPFLQLGHVSDHQISNSPPPHMTRRGRRIVVPARYTDYLIPKQTAMRDTPLPPLSLPPSPPRPNSPSHQPSPERQIPHPVPIYRSEPNSNDPALSTTLEDSADTEWEALSSSWGIFGQVLDEQSSPPFESTRNNHSPFPNPTIDWLMTWHCDSNSTKPLNSLDSLVQDVILQPDFDIKHLQGFRARAAAAILDKSISAQPDEKLPFQASKGWIDDMVDIPLPRARSKADKSTAPTITVKGVHHRNLHDVIQAEMHELYTAQFYLKPYKLFWQPSGNRPIQRVYGEGYTSDRMLQLEAEINTKVNSLSEGSIKHEIGIVCIGLYSDSTLLANFGNVSLWPVYFTFVNCSKYKCLKLGSRGMNHLIYFPSLPTTIQEHYQIHFNHLASNVEL